MKFDVNALRYLSKEEFRVLTAVEMGMRNHEIVPAELVERIASLKRGGAFKNLNTLLRHKLVHHDSSKYNGYRLTTLGYDFLAIKTLVNRGAVAAVGRQIGVGKESDIYEVETPEGDVAVLKLHRLGRTSFRNVKAKRDYLHKRRAHNWLYLSRLAALKEFAFMKALGDRDFPVPQALECNRHCVLMSLVKAVPLVQVREIANPGYVFDQVLSLIVRLAHCGLIHCDFNEFNLMLDKRENIVMIDFPQMVSVSHRNAKMYFDRDVECIFKFFGKRFNFAPPPPPDMGEWLARCLTVHARQQEQQEDDDGDMDSSKAERQKGGLVEADVGDAATSGGGDGQLHVCGTEHLGQQHQQQKEVEEQPAGMAEFGAASSKPAGAGAQAADANGSTSDAQQSLNKGSEESTKDGEVGGGDDADDDDMDGRWRPEFAFVVARHRCSSGGSNGGNGMGDVGGGREAEEENTSLDRELAASGFTSQNEADLESYREELEEQEGQDDKGSGSQEEEDDDDADGVGDVDDDEEDEDSNEEGEDAEVEEGSGDDRQQDSRDASALHSRARAAPAADLQRLAVSDSADVSPDGAQASLQTDHTGLRESLAAGAMSDETEGANFPEPAVRAGATGAGAPSAAHEGGQLKQQRRLGKQRVRAAAAVRPGQRYHSSSRNAVKDKGGKRSRHSARGSGAGDF